MQNFCNRIAPRFAEERQVLGEPPRQRQRRGTPVRGEARTRQELGHRAPSTVRSLTLQGPGRAGRTHTRYRCRRWAVGKRRYATRAALVFRPSGTVRSPGFPADGRRATCTEPGTLPERRDSCLSVWRRSDLPSVWRRAELFPG